MNALAFADPPRTHSTAKATSLRLTRPTNDEADTPKAGTPSRRAPVKAPVLDYALAADLRRKRSRELSASLVDLSQWLDPQDRALILSVLRDNLTAAEVAQARAVSARGVRRRLRALISHMAAPQYAYAAAHAPKWPDLRRSIATASILRVRSAREAARELNLSLHTVRTEVRIIQALAQQ